MMNLLKKRSIQIFLLVHLLLILAWSWCHDGAVIHVKVRIKDYHATILYDDRPVATFHWQGNRSGCIGLGFESHFQPILKIGKPSWDNVVVRDYYTGKILFEDDFSDGSHKWDLVSGDGYIDKKGRFTSNGKCLIIAGDRNWEDIIIEADLYNSFESKIMFRYAHDKSHLKFKLRNWRENGIACSVVGPKKSKIIPKLHIIDPQAASVKVIAAIFLRSYGMAWAILICVGGIYFALTLLFGGLEFLIRILRSSADSV